MKPSRFKAAVFVGARRPLEIRELSLPDPGPGEVLVRLAASGVCHSDLHVLNGDWKAPSPMVLGHEGAGSIAAVGEGVCSLREDDHVILSWVSSCRRCDYCVAGRPVLCRFARSTSSQHRSADGGTRLKDGADDVYAYLGLGTFGEYALVPETAAVKIRKDAPFAQAALVGCAVTTGIGAVTNTARVEPGSTVLVIGCGGVGINVVQGAKLAGAKHIIAADVTEEKLALGKQFGATHLVNSRETDLLSAVLDITGEGVDYAFEAIGLGPTVEAAYSATRRGGTTVIVGQAADGVRISLDPFSMSVHEKQVIGSNYGSTRQQIDFPKIVDLYMEGRIDLDSMITSRIRLEDLNRAFSSMQNGKGIRAVIEY